MKIELAIRNQGHVPSFKNNKMIARGRLITAPQKQKWMNRCIQSFESQLFCGSATIEGGMLTGQQLQSLIALFMPQDDSRQWIPELHILSEDVDKGSEGAIVIIEPI